MKTGHLEGDGVGAQTVPSTVGPALQIVPGKELFVSNENYDLGCRANTMLKREYRKPFVVPESA